MKNKLFRCVAVLLIMCMLTACGSKEENNNNIAPTTPVQYDPTPTPSVFGEDGSYTLPDSAFAMRDMTTQEIIDDMGLGINLGNTMEATGISASTVKAYETCWGSPEITPQMIEGYKNCGFGVIRIPVAWSNLMNNETYEINADLMARVKQIVEYALACDMYVILNIHWDGGWFENFPTNYDECMKNTQQSGHRLPRTSRITAISLCSNLLTRKAVGTVYGIAGAAMIQTDRKHMIFLMI